MHKERPQEILRRMEAMLAPYGVATSYGLKTQASNQFLSDEIRGLGVFSTIMPAIFLAVAALVLNVLMVRLIDQQRTDHRHAQGDGLYRLADLRALHQVCPGLGVVGGLVGLGLGYGMAEFVTIDLPHVLRISRPGKPALSPAPIAGGLAVALGCSLVGSLQAARAALRLNPAEAMRPNRQCKAAPSGWNISPGSGSGSASAGGWCCGTCFAIACAPSVGMFATAMGAGLLVCGFMLTSADRLLDQLSVSRWSRAATSTCASRTNKGAPPCSRPAAARRRLCRAAIRRELARSSTVRTGAAARSRACWSIAG